MYDLYETALLIRKTAHEKGITLKSLAEQSGIGNNFMAHLTGGKAISSLGLAQIADVLGVSMDFLMGRTDKPEINR